MMFSSHILSETVVFVHLHLKFISCDLKSIFLHDFHSCERWPKFDFLIN